MENVEYVISFSFLVAIIIIVFTIRLANKPKNCSICEAKTKDLYINENDDKIPFCRNHLIDRWKSDVLKSYFDMIIIEPDFMEYPCGYLYATIPKLAEWQYPKEAQDNASSILDSIKNKTCKECSSVASVAYFNKEDYSFPNIESIKPAEIYFCKRCAVNMIESHIRNAEKSFMCGLYAPTNDRGVYHVQEF